MANKGIFLEDWSIDYITKYDKTDSPIKQMSRDFNEDLEDVNVLLAIYTYEGYEGNAFVLFEEDGALYEVNAGHCSCYGLEDQWRPELVSLKEIKHRIEHGYLGGYRDYNYNTGEYEKRDIFGEQLLEVLKDYEHIEDNDLLRELEGE
jgi:hypothetical protein